MTLDEETRPGRARDPCPVPQAGTRGFTIIELLAVIVVVGIIALIAIPSFLSLRTKAYNAKAMGVGRMARVTQSAYKSVKGGVLDGYYAPNLAELVVINNDLIDDEEVTFTFGTANISGYTMYITHAKGDDTYTITQNSGP